MRISIYLHTCNFQLINALMYVVIPVSMYESIFHSFIHHLVQQNKDKIIYILILEMLDTEIMHQDKKRKYVV